MIELHPDYYWRNLRTVVETVLDAHPGLFTPEQHALFEAWRDLPRAAQLLHSRLLMRKGPDFRRNSLTYTEVGDLDRALVALVEAQLATLDPPITVAERLEHFTVPELKILGTGLGLPLRGRRPAMVEALLSLPSEPVEAALRALDPLVRRHGGSAFSRAQVVFFGNRQQDMTTFVRVALDQLKYAEYQVDRSHPLFPDRTALDDYLAAGARWDAAFEARMADDDATLVRLGAEAALDLARRPEVAPFRARVDPARADARVVYRAARAHERSGRIEEASALYTLLVTTRRHLPTAARAGDRLGLMLQRAERATAGASDGERSPEGRSEPRTRRAEKAKSPPGLAQHLLPLLTEPGLDDPSRRLLERRLRLAQCLPPEHEHPEPVIPEQELIIRGFDRPGDPPSAPSRPRADDDLEAGRPGSRPPSGPSGATGQKALYLGQDGHPRTVEEAVLERLGGDGVWCEGGLYTTLFALLCWDIIFAPLPGAFQHPFQDAPVDFDTALFYLRREQRFTHRFAYLRTADLEAELLESWQNHQGCTCRGLWDRFPIGLLTRTATTLGPRLIPLLERLARHPARHGAGLPDLLVFTPEGPLLVEVKGPGDQPSVEQQLWHAFFMENDIPFVLMRVRRAG